MTQFQYHVRQTRPEDIPHIIELCRCVYPDTQPWNEAQLKSHQDLFPEGQLVVEDLSTSFIAGFAASFIVRWDDFDWNTPWRDFTARGYFTNHDPEHGRTLYGAEIMVHPMRQGTGAGSILYKAREELARRLGLLRIRAGARLRGYHRYADTMSAEDYTRAVIAEKLRDPTLSFQLKRKFHVLRVVSDYLLRDPESLGYAAVIEWINSDIAQEEDYKYLQQSVFYRDPK